jgi:hypothetical protein
LADEGDDEADSDEKFVFMGDSMLRFARGDEGREFGGWLKADMVVVWYLLLIV